MERIAAAAFLVLAVSVAASCGSKTTETVTTTVGEKADVAPPADLVLFGTIEKMTPDDGGYRIRFDPAWMLTGETASSAAAEDGMIEPGEPLPNDYYRVDDGHRLLTYSLPRDARITVLRDGVEGSEITVDELGQLVRGKSPWGKPLFEPITTGFWMRVHGDTIRALDQQYIP